MRIIHIIPILGCGGAEILLGNIVKKQFLNGNDVFICCLYKHHKTFDNYPNRDFILKNIPIQIIKTRVKFSLKNKPKIIGDDYERLLDKFQPDVIHSHLYEAEIIAMSSIRKNVSYFSHIHDNIFQFNKLKINNLFSRQKMGQFIETNWLYSRFRLANSTFLCVSNDVLNFMKYNLSVDFTKKIKLLLNGIDIEKFTCDEKRDLSKVRIVSVGNLVTKKNHQLLIEIALQLKKNISSDFQIDILGYGPLFENLTLEIKNNNLQNNIFLRGSVGNVDQYYKSANIYIHTATYEPFGLVLVEAMASGLPLIALDGKGNRDLFEGKNNGFLILKNDPKLFVDKIKLLINDVELYSTISNNCIEFSKQFGIDSYVEKLNSIYRSIMEQSVV